MRVWCWFECVVFRIVETQGSVHASLIVGPIYGADVSFLVGHKDPSTTAKYVHAVREHAEEALRAVSSGLADQKTADKVPAQATLPVAVGQELLMDTC